MGDKILFDLIATQPFGEFKFHGGGLYGEVLFQKLLEYKDLVSIYVVYNAKKYINSDLLFLCDKYNIKKFDVNTISIKKILQENDIKKFYQPFSYGIVDVPDDCLIINTIHGLRTLEIPYDSTSYQYCDTFYKKIINFLERIIISKYRVKRTRKTFSQRFEKSNYRFMTVSNHSKYTIKSFFPFINEKNIPVFYSPSLDSINKLEYAEIPSSINSKYFLLVNGNRWMKNNIRVIHALDEILTEGKTFQVVVTGSSNFSSLKKKLINIENFIFLDYVEKNVLNSLYKRAYALLYPSLNEGFGYPPIDSMRYSVPVAASCFSSIPEICGDAVLYFNPYSVSEMKNRIYQLLNEEIYCNMKQLSSTRYNYILLKQKKDLVSSIDYILNC